MALLAGRTAIVTGASSGIGAACAEALGAEGAHVVLAARDEGRLAQVANGLAGVRGRVLAVATDGCNEASVQRLFERARELTGHVDILVNSSGVGGSGVIDELPLSAWQHTITTNLTGVFLCCREAVRLMKPRSSGRIINIGSVAAKVPRLNSVPYAASKAGLDGLTRALALDLRSFGIAVSIPHPGNTESAMWDKARERADSEGLMAAADVARAVLLMATLPASTNFLEGTVLPVSMPLLGRG